MSDTVKLVIEIDEEVWDWFVTKSFIPIMYYDSLANSMEKAVHLSEVLDEIKTEIISKHFNIVEKSDFDNGRTYGYDECLSIIDKHISGEGDKE